MSLHILAHAGEIHETAAEETEHNAQTATVSLPLDAVVGGGTLLALVAFWLLATRVLKWRLTIRLLVVMIVLLIVGVASYQSTPITSTIALACGFGLALANVFLQLTRPKPKPHQD